MSDSDRGKDRRRRPPDAAIGYIAGLPPKLLLDRLPVPILAVHQDGTVVHANVAFEQMLGYLRSELVDQPADQLFVDTSSPRPAPVGLRAAAGEVVDLRHRDGSTVKALGEQVRPGARGRPCHVGRVPQCDRATLDARPPGPGSALGRGGGAGVRTDDIVSAFLASGYHGGRYAHWNLDHQLGAFLSDGGGMAWVFTDDVVYNAVYAEILARRRIGSGES